MKITVIADVHGRLCWNDIVKKESDSDLFVFLGDYVSTHDDVTEDQQCSNFEDILNFKEENPDKVILLRGNHLNQHLGYSWAECSGYFRNVGQWCREQRDRILKDTQWIYLFTGFEKPIIFSHAGVSAKWMNQLDIETVEEINSIEPNEDFGFNPGPDNIWDSYGDSMWQGCEWIRPTSLIKCNVLGYTQVIGHTPVKEIFNVREKVSKVHDDIWLCDCLPHQYLVIENNKFEVKCLE